MPDEKKTEEKKPTHPIHVALDELRSKIRAGEAWMGEFLAMLDAMCADFEARDVFSYENARELRAAEGSTPPADSK